MSVQFWPCPGCSCHVKRGDAICPFCGESASVDIGPTRVLAGRLSRAALFAAGAMGAAVATTDCGTPPSSTAFYGAISPPLEMLEDSGVSDAGPGLVIGDGGLSTIETEDASATDGPSEADADAGDASTSTAPTDSSSASDSPSTTDGPADAEEASAPSEPTDSSSTAKDAPSAVALYGGIAPPYGHVPVPDE